MAEKKKWYQKFWDGTASSFVRRLLLYAIIINVTAILWPVQKDDKRTELFYNSQMIQIVVELTGIGIISAIKENKKDE